jgi:phosphoribosylglycinamide formyltransferase-1
MQAAVPVLAGDDAKALSARVLAMEHRIYPQSVRWFVEDALVWSGEVVHHRDGAPQQLFVS